MKHWLSLIESCARFQRTSALGPRSRSGPKPNARRVTRTTSAFTVIPQQLCRNAKKLAVAKNSMVSLGIWKTRACSTDLSNQKCKRNLYQWPPQHSRTKGNEARSTRTRSRAQYETCTAKKLCRALTHLWQDACILDVFFYDLHYKGAEAKCFCWRIILWRQNWRRAVRCHSRS